MDGHFVCEELNPSQCTAALQLEDNYMVLSPTYKCSVGEYTLRYCWSHISFQQGTLENDVKEDNGRT